MEIELGNRVTSSKFENAMARTGHLVSKPNTSQAPKGDNGINWIRIKALATD